MTVSACYTKLGPLRGGYRVDLLGQTAERDRCSLGDAMPILLVEGVQRAGARRSAARGRDVVVKRTDDRSDDGRQDNRLD